MTHLSLCPTPTAMAMHMHLSAASPPLLTVIIKDQVIEVTSRGLHPDILVHVLCSVQSQSDGVSQRLAMVRPERKTSH